ncbi:biotin--[acetyl-CoA-carboxylase] ligase [Marinobacter sp. DY40_1A1]|uniref:biotin--[acetyl-CoA-carboxylase] ligase n=1 Tax=Marinobacter sp. DY40_1A1 TaxID=2583229 RepID=UPI0019037EC9|nr:biotin--[acetyl-CoA-carboxylase] ligase [Marinobacter sp. DY40_1A1]MBK1888374.1 biotin--[acetyl-CoA-carboxylase] ligase [Marinobacter sp. DY40_1A1]
MKLKALVALLSDGQVHSGESLAQELGVSRTAIWKQVKRLMDRGFEVASIRGRGYQLMSRVDLLDSAMILAHLDEELAARIDLRVCDEVDSTNAEVLRQVAEGCGSKLPISIADCQTAGRGRRGRSWQSPRGENLYLSMGLVFHGGFSVLDGLSLVFGVAVAEALEMLGVTGVGLKWPNDIFLPAGKLGGILVELQGELQEGVVRVVVGIGINVHMLKAGGVDQPWSSLASACPDTEWTRNRVAAAVIGAVADAADDFSNKGFGVFHEPWQKRDIYNNRLIQAKDGELKGVGNGIDGSGNYLLVTSDGGVVPIRAGEISLRVAP